MKVLLTGASGFVGSHVLEALLARRLPTAILLRDSSSRKFINGNAGGFEVRSGSITQPESLRLAMEGITHVIHCAGCTKASRNAEYSEINHHGTACVVQAANERAPAVKRLIHISSLAASGPATPEAPAREDAAPSPVSEYGRSKLAGESEVRNRCRSEFTILRPPAVYGPRDTGFLSMFRAVRNHLLPKPSKTQALSLVYARDLADAVVGCMENQAGAGKTYFVSSKEIVTARRLAELIAQAMRVWTLPVPLPAGLLWPICLIQELVSRITGRASLLNLQKFAELRASGWVCEPSRLERELGIRCGTELATGIPQTLEWYQREHWL